MEELIVKSLSDYIMLLEKLKKECTYYIKDKAAHNEQYIVEPRFIFRGHENGDNYKLLPGIFRKSQKDNEGYYWTESFSQTEFEILNDYICEACGYMKDVPVTDYMAWLEIAQHFQVPTRLLDFTYNSLVALYFACSSQPEIDGAVWILDENGYRETFYNKYKSDYAIKSKAIIEEIVYDEIIKLTNAPHGEEWHEYPWIYKPMYRANRMYMQSSVFLIWGKSHSPLEQLIKYPNYISPNNNHNEQDRHILGKIRIPHSSKENIINQLEICGINEKFIFPGMDGIGHYIRNKYSDPINPMVREFRSGGVSIELKKR